jgi:opacity protein-like surface antigen
VRRGAFRAARRIFSALVTGTIVPAVSIIVLATQPAHALPSFARQTGQPCGTCHTDFPGLTPYGRLFKLRGYTTGGGPYRTTLFPTSDDSAPSDDKKWIPPVSMMSIIGFTNTQAPLAPPTAPYWPNNNVVVSPSSFFWGGAITDHIGAFAQVTYNEVGPGGFGTDPFGHTWTWDNTDIRYANATNIGGFDVVYGITANNSPTVQDPWNTTPAWAFPYAASTIAGTPATHTIVNGTFAAHVASVGAYGWINDVLYLEGSVYRTLDFSTQNDLGTDPFDAPGLLNAAPYWRIAFEPHWGRNWLEAGTFGMVADVHPWAFPGTTITATFPQTDKYTDFGFDSQYQYQGDNFWLTLRGSYIHEIQNLDASFANGLSANANNDLNEAKLYASLAYGNDDKVVLTGQYFDTWGSPDPILYSGLASGFSPNSNGFIAELAYIPSVSNGWWPWLSARFGLQYTWYNKFDGTTVGAQDNNTLFLYAWFAMPAFGVYTGPPTMPTMPTKALPLKAPPLPLFTWTGCYAGFQGAGAWGTKDLTDTTGVVAASTGFTSASLSINGYLLGGQLGCDDQFGSNWVVGIEGALAGGDVSASTGVAQPFGIPGDTATYKETTDYLSSVTGRVGYAWDRWLGYVKGGAAMAGDKYDAVGVFQGTPYGFEGLETRLGWTAGVGLEWAFWDDWSVKLEYDYYGFGQRNVTFIDPNSGNSGLEQIKQSIQTVKLGLNFHLLDATPWRGGIGALTSAY